MDISSSLVSASISSDTATIVLPPTLLSTLASGTGVEFLEVEWELVCGDAGIKSCVNPGTLYAHALELRILVPVR